MGKGQAGANSGYPVGSATAGPGQPPIPRRLTAHQHPVRVVPGPCRAAAASRHAHVRGVRSCRRRGLTTEVFRCPNLLPSPAARGGVDFLAHRRGDDVAVAVRDTGPGRGQRRLPGFRGPLRDRRPGRHPARAQDRPARPGRTGGRAGVRRADRPHPGAGGGRRTGAHPQPEERAVAEKRLTGYRRPDGRAGIRNHVVILPVDDLSNAAAESVARAIPGTLAIPHPYGRLQFGADLDLFFQTMIGTGANPNVAAAVVIGIEPAWTAADRGRHRGDRQAGGAVLHRAARRPARAGDGRAPRGPAAAGRQRAAPGPGRARRTGDEHQVRRVRHHQRPGRQPGDLGRRWTGTSRRAGR